MISHAGNLKGKECLGDDLLFSFSTLNAQIRNYRLEKVDIHESRRPESY